MTRDTTEIQYFDFKPIKFEYRITSHGQESLVLRQAT